MVGLSRVYGDPLPKNRMVPNGAVKKTVPKLGFLNTMLSVNFL